MGPSIEFNGRGSLKRPLNPYMGSNETIGLFTALGGDVEDQADASDQPQNLIQMTYHFFLAR